MLPACPISRDNRKLKHAQKMLIISTPSVGSALQLVYLSREAGGNPRPTATHAKVDEAASLMSQTVAELTSMLEKAGGEARLISGEGRRGGGGGGSGDLRAPR